MEWQGEANSASISVTGGSKLHLKLPGNYRLDQQWRDDLTETLQFTFTTRPPAHLPSPTHYPEEEWEEEEEQVVKKKKKSRSQLLLGGLILLCLLCLLCLLMIGPLHHGHGRSTSSDRGTNFTREQLIASGRI